MLHCLHLLKQVKLLPVLLQEPTNRQNETVRQTDIQTDRMRVSQTDRMRVSQTDRLSQIDRYLFPYLLSLTMSDTTEIKSSVAVLLLTPEES